MSAWKVKQETIRRLLDENLLEETHPATRQWALEQLNVCERHIASAERADPAIDPEGCLVLAYSAARKASSTLLQLQGLRAKGGEGSHLTVAEAVGDQFGGAFKRLNRHRRGRNTVEYPSPGGSGIDPDDAQLALNDAREILSAARTLANSEHLTAWSN